MLCCCEHGQQQRDCIDSGQSFLRSTRFAHLHRPIKLSRSVLIGVENGWPLMGSIDSGHRLLNATDCIKQAGLRLCSLSRAS